MAMFNNFPATYQTPYYPQMQQPMQQPIIQQPQQPVNNNSIIWVQGEAGAKSYLVAPNTTVQLWDSESQTIYLKSADASGMPSIKTLDYTIRAENQPIQTLAIDENKFVSREELDDLKNRLSALNKEVERLKPKNNNRKEDKHYE